MSFPSTDFALFDDNLDGKGDLLFVAPRACIRCTEASALDDAFAAIETARSQGKWVVVATAYELGYVLEPRLAERSPRTASPLLTAWVYDRVEQLTPEQTRERLAAHVAGLEEHERIAGVMDVRQEVEKADYCDSVSRIRELIADGDCYQVNYTIALAGQLFGSPHALYRVLRDAQPVRHGALLCHAEGAILSRSPELFVERRDGRLTCRPMKGTAPRDRDPARLAKSEKDRAENIMIVDLIRNDLGRIAPSGGVHVEGLCEIEGYPSVWQMTSTVVAEPVSAGIAEVFRALFPCGSITGAPKIRAMEVIGELEHAPRGLYCGALGWIAPNGDFRFSVPIRTLEVDRNGRARLGLGSGVVADSEPESEWGETLLKGRFLTALEPPFGLIETLRCEPGSSEPYPLLARHLARLRRSAEAFGFPVDEASLRKALAERAQGLQGLHRVRVELRSSGQFSISASPVEDAPAHPPTVCLSPRPISSADPLLRHKTTARERYDSELREAMAAGHFDVLFFNERGELAEGARTNVYLDLGEGWLLTPPLECGVLDGVYRRKLMDEGKAREQRLGRVELSKARAVLLSNAARGIFRVELAADQ